MGKQAWRRDSRVWPQLPASPPHLGGLPLSVWGRDLAEDLALEEMVTYPSADFAQLPGKRGERPEPLKGLVFGERSYAARI